MADREDRFRIVFDAGYGPVWAYARRRVVASDVEDVVADVMAVAWRRLEDVPDDDQALPWLYGVARRTIANRRRSQHRRARLLERLGRERTVDTPRDDRPDVIAALERLRPSDREVLRLAAWEQLGPAEIAVVLGCSANAAALRLSRARRRLRAAMTGSASSRTQDERKVTDV